MVNIEGLPKPRVLAALYNNSRPVGVGQYQFNPDHKMTYREAEKLLENKTTYDLLYGRVMYFTMEPDATEIDNTLYDKYLKDDGRMERVINDIKKSKGIK